jgi:uncharacterized protein (TIGR02391 family)
MAFTKQQRLQVFRILAEAEDGITVNRLINGTFAFVNRGGGTTSEGGHDKVEALEEYIRVFWQELITKGYIIPIDNYNKDWYKLSSKGKKQHERLKDSPTEPLDVDLDSIVFHEQLKEEVRIHFEDGEYIKCVKEAAGFLEQELRHKTDAPPSERGADLATFAFKPQKGKLVDPYSQDKGHEEGIHILYRGAFNYIRNLAIHHSKILNDQTDNLQMLTFLDLLIRLLDKSTPREP